LRYVVFHFISVLSNFPFRHHPPFFYHLLHLEEMDVYSEPWVFVVVSFVIVRVLDAVGDILQQAVWGSICRPCKHFLISGNDVILLFLISVVLCYDTNCKLPSAKAVLTVLLVVSPVSAVGAFFVSLPCKYVIW
jgi:hypothetical protein